MNTNSKRPLFIHQKLLFRILIFSFILVLIISFIYLVLIPSPSPWYYGGIISEIGAPQGMTVDKNSSGNRQAYTGFLFGDPYASRNFIGKVSYDSIRKYYINKLNSIGFHNAHWQDNHDGTVAGIWASCKQTQIVAEFNQSVLVPDTDPLQIEVSQNFRDGPPCPHVMPAILSYSQFL